MPKKYLDINVYDSAISRLEYLYDNFSEDEIWLSFSGGKDSTACFHLIKEVALKRGIKSINILIIDLEGHYKDHVIFMEEIINDKEIQVNGYWVCLPFNLSNSSSAYRPKWLCWEKEEEDIWIREMPQNRLIVNEDNDVFGEYFRKGMEFEEFIVSFPKFLIEQKGLKRVAQIIGIRTQESYNRHLKIAVSKNRDFYNGERWMLRPKATGYDVYSVHPIYDWLVEDIWKYLSNKSYTKVYDKMYLTGCTLHNMRICQPYGAEQRDNIDLFAKIEPKTWDKMTYRVNGANFANLYKGKHLLKGRITKPDNITWEDWSRLHLNTFPPFLREHYLGKINVFLRWWRKEIYQDIKYVYTKKYESNENIDEDGLYVVNIYDEHKDDTTKKVPSWRRIGKVLAKGDYACKNLSFQTNKNEYEKEQALRKKYEKELYK